MAEAADTVVLETNMKCKNTTDMKKLIVLLGATFLALVSCQKETPVLVEEPQAETPAESAVPKISYSLDALHPDSGVTKAVKTGWETGDVIFVFFSGAAAPGYLEMKWDGTQWNFTEKNGLAVPDGQPGTMYAVYQPFGNDNEITADEYGRWKFKDIHLTYYLNDSQSYTITDGQVSGTFNMSIPHGFVQFFLDDPLADSSTEMELREKNITPYGVHSVHPEHGMSLVQYGRGAPLPGYVYDKENKAAGEQKGWLFSGMLDYTNTMGASADYHFTLVKDGWQGTYYQKSFLNKQYYTSHSERRALKMPALSTWTELTDCKPIDLGTDLRYSYTRVYWSSRNLGASADYPASDALVDRQATWGDYYAWGATAPYYTEGHAYDNPCSDWKYGKTGYNWGSYPYSGNNVRSLFKYTIPDGEDDADWYDEHGQFCGDGLRWLEPEDDAATAALGARWRMPTAEEWDILFNKSNFTISYDPDLRGLTFTSKIPGYEGRSIFLPFAGVRISDTLSNTDQAGYYWSMDLSADVSPEARAAVILNSEEGSVLYGLGRFRGLPIRPVTY